MTRLEKRAWSPEGKALESVACNVCGSRDGRLCAVENALHVLRCRECGLYYVSPRPTQAELERFYEEYFPEESEEHWRRVMKRLFRRDAERFQSLVGRPGRLLDVGAGFGHFLERMRDRGWEVAAVEWSQRGVERLLERDIEVYEGALPEVKLPEKHFDAVSAAFVLEHAADPVGVLAACRRALRPGGWVLTRVPNLSLLSLFFHFARIQGLPPARPLLRALRREIIDEENLFSVLDPPAHLFGFDHATLRRAFARAGFRDVRVAGDPMLERGDALNAAVDGGVFAASRVLAALSGGRVQLAPNVACWGRR